MSITSIQDAISNFREFPYPSNSTELMARTLSQHEGLFAGRDFQFFISMGLALHVILDDGYYGIRGAEQSLHAWFTIEPHYSGLNLRIGRESEILGEQRASVAEAARLLSNGIRYLMENAER